MMYKQITKLDIYKLRDFCIRNRFYTHGDCRAYENMFEMARTYNGEVEILTNIARDIYDHSGYDEIIQFAELGRDDEDEVLTTMMMEIFRTCVDVWFE